MAHPYRKWSELESILNQLLDMRSLLSYQTVCRVLNETYYTLNQLQESWKSLNHVLKYIPAGYKLELLDDISLLTRRMIMFISSFIGFYSEEVIQPSVSQVSELEMYGFNIMI